MRGRSHRSAKKRRILLETIADGFSVSEAARRAGMPRRCVYDWKLEDAAFAADLANAYEEGTDGLADDARRMAKDDPAVLIYLLKQRDPKRFNQKQIEVLVSGDPNAPIGVEHSVADKKAWIFPQAALERPEQAMLPRGETERAGAGPIIDAVVEDAPEDRDPDEDPASEAA
jgi:hypothetical protein